MSESGGKFVEVAGILYWDNHYWLGFASKNFEHGNSLRLYGKPTVGHSPASLQTVADQRILRASALLLRPTAFLFILDGGRRG